MQLVAGVTLVGWTRPGATLGLEDCAGIAAAADSARTAAADDGPQFRVTLDPASGQRVLSGRLFVFLTQREGREPMSGPDWFHPEPFAGLDVQAIRPGESCEIDDGAEKYHFPPPPGRYFVQAVLHQNLDSQHHAIAEGNVFSDRVEVELAADGEVSLALTHVVPPPPPLTGEWIRELAVESPLLSGFYCRQVVEKATVVLPESYARDAQRRYPVMYIIPGFGGTHRGIGAYTRAPPRAEDGEAEFIRVFLSGDCQYGHHSYADSATNGPRGQFFVSELIPYVDSQFRTVAAATARFATGHSSGGWSSLWLQVKYPDSLGGVWSTSPDPVDFRDYQQVDLYASPPLSLYDDEQGQPRPIARVAGQPVLWYRNFGEMDDCLKRGGQLRSFEAAFSPRGAGGEPQKLWDRRTGRINPQVAKAWEAYDIRLVIERSWPELRDKLAGKLTIVTGELDTFYLEGAVRRLAESLTQLGSDARIEILPGRDHNSVLSTDLLSRFRREMTAAFFRHHPL